MNITLSQFQVEKIAGKQLGVIEYSELSGVASLDSILVNNCCLILYENEPGQGHWTCIIKRGNTYDFFDPYGYSVDSEFRYIPVEMQRQLHEVRGRLKKLLGNNFVENTHQYQGLADGINTCGRWTGLRCLFSDYSEDDFYKLIQANKVNDKKLVQLTNQFL